MLRSERARARRRAREKQQVYLRSKAATDSPVFTGKFHFLSTNGRLKGTNIGFGYYFFDLRPILYLLDLYPRNKLHVQNQFRSAIIYIIISFIATKKI